MKPTISVYESPTYWDIPFIMLELMQGIPVGIVEPFHAYHHERGIRFYPSSCPRLIENLLRNGRLFLIKASDLDARNFIFIAADKAVDTVEDVYNVFRENHGDLIRYIREALKSPKAENVFKKWLCDRLAVYYSIEILIERIEGKYPGQTIKIAFDGNPYIHRYMADLLSRSGIQTHRTTTAIFSVSMSLKSLSAYLTRIPIAYLRIVAQTTASLFSMQQTAAGTARSNYKYAFALNSPSRQLADNKRGPDFLIDGHKILKEETVCLPLVPLTESQEKKLGHLGLPIHRVPSIKRNFTHFYLWKGLTNQILNRPLYMLVDLVNQSAHALAEYLRWKRIAEEISIRHFIAAAEFGIAHIARNIALHECGVETWYFTDSMNLSFNFIENGGEFRGRHPFWAYLCYDHFVTWSKAISDYYADHPQCLKKRHVVGCLWAQHVGKPKELGTNGMAKLFTIAVFDTTYTRNGVTSYEEGIRFAQDLITLVSECRDIRLLIKEKKDKKIHRLFDPERSHALLELYEEMERHPRVEIYGDGEDASRLVSLSDLVISFPFTSTTFEALSVGKDALWHDPLGLYTKTPFARIPKILTHSYEDLKRRVMELKDSAAKGQKRESVQDPTLLDPFMDQNAIDRFRDLLVSS